MSLLSPSILRTMADRRRRLDLHGAFPLDEIETLRTAGALAAPLPVTHGGSGLGTSPEGALPALLLLRDIGAANLSLARLYEGHINAVKLVVRYGTPQQIARMAGEITTGLMFAIWNTEAGNGVKLIAGPAGFTLSGKKLFASGVGFLRRAILTARHANGANVLVHAAIDPATQPFSHEKWRLQGMQATATGEIDLSGIGIAEASIIGGDGDYMKEPDFSAGAWRTLAAQSGAMDALLALFLADLQNTGRGVHPIQRARLAEVAIACETARLWLHTAAPKAEGGIEPPSVAITYVNLARAAIARGGEEIIARVQRGIGARAFLMSNPVEQIARDLSFYLRQPAPDQTLDEAAEFLLKPR